MAVSRPGSLVGGAVFLGIGVLMVPAVLMVMVLVGADNEASIDGCAPVMSEAGEGVSADQLTQQQLGNAMTIIAVGGRIGVPRRATVIALATAHQESGFLNYANDGLGTDLRPSQKRIGRSLGLPHDAVGTDHGSLGVFQQQWPWWGSMRELMDPATAAQKFYTRLLKVPHWSTMPVTEAAQAVQKSAHPTAHADDEALAVQLVTGLDTAWLTSKLGPSTGSTSAVWTGGGTGSDCVQAAAYTGDIVMPIDASASFTDLHNFGAHGGRWTREHTGTDFSAACGTAVLAAHDGTVVVKNDQSWSGRWLVQVTTGPGSLTTWYAHMQSLDVVNGQSVQAGQTLGRVGAEGNASGCHLHFEVHPKGGSIYQDETDPSLWLRSHLGSRVEPVAATSADSFVIASFNVLGHSHTAPGGNKPGWGPSEQRMRGTISLLDAYGVEVVGFQEFQPRQRQALLAHAGDRYAVYSPPDGTANSIAWRHDRWAFVSADTFKIPYFDGRPADMPIVRLRNLTTGQAAIFVNVHNPASTRRYPGQERFRDQATRREIAVVEGLRGYQEPIYLTGDFNEREEAFCALTAGGNLTASAGGSNTDHCSLPRRAGIDWTFGSNRTSWAGHIAVRRGVQGRISDHPFVVARAVEAAAGAGGGRQ